MQKNMNNATKFNPADVSNLKFSAVMLDECGEAGEYWCEAETLDEAVCECVRAAREYAEHLLGVGDKVERFSISERMPNGETVARGRWTAEGHPIVESYYGREVDFDAASPIMDEELREEVHADLAPCSPQAFFDEYSRRHEQRFGQDFPPYVGGAW